MIFINRCKLVSSLIICQCRYWIPNTFGTQNQSSEDCLSVAVAKWLESSIRNQKIASFGHCPCTAASNINRYCSFTRCSAFEVRIANLSNITLKPTFNTYLPARTLTKLQRLVCVKLMLIKYFTLSRCS
jgi:hypothetical protein